MALSARQIAEQKRQAEELLFAGPEHLGFAKSLFFGHFKPGLFPYPVLPPAEKATSDEAVAKVLAAHRAESGLWLSRDGWVLRFQLRRLRELARARAVGEPEWGLLAEVRSGSGAALVRLSRDAVDVLDAAWTSEAARDAVLSGLRDCCVRAGRDLLRLWPSHQLRGLFPELPRPSARSMCWSATALT